MNIEELVTKDLTIFDTMKHVKYKEAFISTQDEAIKMLKDISAIVSPMMEDAAIASPTLKGSLMVDSKSSLLYILEKFMDMVEKFKYEGAEMKIKKDEFGNFYLLVARIKEIQNYAYWSFCLDMMPTLKKVNPRWHDFLVDCLRMMHQYLGIENFNECYYSTDRIVDEFEAIEYDDDNEMGKPIKYYKKHALKYIDMIGNKISLNEFSLNIEQFKKGLRPGIPVDLFNIANKILTISRTDLNVRDISDQSDEFYSAVEGEDNDFLTVSNRFFFSWFSHEGIIQYTNDLIGEIAGNSGSAEPAISKRCYNYSQVLDFLENTRDYKGLEAITDVMAEMADIVYEIRTKIKFDPDV